MNNDGNNNRKVEDGNRFDANYFKNDVNNMQNISKL